MSKQFYNKILFLVISCFISMAISQDCNLPSGQKSTCVPLHLCDYFAKIYEKYNRRLPDDVVSDVRNHLCTQRNSICCPDNSQVAPPLKIQQPNTESIVDYNALRSHPNFNLLNDKSCGQANSDRIVGGWDAKIREIPWLALLGFLHRQDFVISWGCGGALISPRFVLSASHCINRGLKKIRLGEHTLSTEKDCDQFESCADPIQDVDIEKTIKHPQFDKFKMKNDIALIKLMTLALTSQNNIKTICVPLDAGDDIEVLLKKNPQPMTISGFGKLGNGNNQLAADILQKAVVPFVKQDECKKKYSEHELEIDQKLFCAGGQNITDTCRGDSGGPITNVGSKAKMMVYGVVVGGVSCDYNGLTLPGVYADIRYYLPWILDTISN